MGNRKYIIEILSVSDKIASIQCDSFQIKADVLELFLHKIYAKEKKVEVTTIPIDTINRVWVYDFEKGWKYPKYNEELTNTLRMFLAK